MDNWKIQKIAEVTGGTLLVGDAELEISSFATDSRTKDEAAMFIPIIGERVDGHDYIAGAWKNGMKATFTSRGEVQAGTQGMTYIKVEDTVAALQRFGGYLRSEVYPIPLVGVTGSVGKTTTKEMIAAALETGFCTLKTEGNMNSQIGLAQMMCRLNAQHEIAVIEMGMSMPGEMERLARVARPNLAVVTNIGVSHIGQLGSMENIRKEKLCLINASLPGTTVLVNGDDPLLRELADDFEGIDLHASTKECLRGMKIMTYGLGEACDFRAQNLVTDECGVSFTACYPGEDGEKQQQIRLAVTGVHNVLNALAAVAVAVTSGLSAEQAAKGLAGYRPIAMRGGMVRKNGLILIDDTYNASPDSMKSGLDVLMETKADRHIAVLADMLELGEMSGQCHRAVGKYAADKKVDFVVTVGNEAKQISEAAEGIETRHFMKNAEALAFLKEYLKAGDAVLMKGSRGMHLEELVQGISEIR